MRAWAAALALTLSSCARAQDIAELSARVDSLAEQLRSARTMAAANYNAIQQLAEAVQLEAHESDQFFERLDVRVHAPDAYCGCGVAADCD